MRRWHRNPYARPAGYVEDLNEAYRERFIGDNSPRFVAGEVVGSKYYSSKRRLPDETLLGKHVWHVEDKPSVAAVEFLGFVIDGSRSGAVFVVEPFADFTKQQQADWKRLQAYWDKSPDVFIVTPLPGGAVEVRKRFTAKSYAALRKTVLDEKNPVVSASLFTDQIAAPAQPVVPLTEQAERLIRTKIMSKTGGNVVPLAILDLLDSLPGWSFENGQFAMPLKDSYDYSFYRRFPSMFIENFVPKGSKQRRWFFRLNANERDQDYVSRSYSAIQKMNEGLFQVGPSAISAEENVSSLGLMNGSFIAEDFRRDETEPGPIVQFSAAQVFCVQQGIKVTAPSGSQYVLISVFDRKTKQQLNYESVGFWKWAYAQGMADLAQSILLATKDVQIAATGGGYATDEEGTGECQVCERRQKLRARDNTVVLVDHGYQYPESEGWRGGLLGYRAGSCPGVGYEPYELSCDLLRESELPKTRNFLLAAQDYLARVERAKRDKEPIVDETRNKILQPSHFDWLPAIDHQIVQAKRQVRGLEALILYLEARIAKWRPKPLPGAKRAASRNGRRGIRLRRRMRLR